MKSRQSQKFNVTFSVMNFRSLQRCVLSDTLSFLLSLIQKWSRISSHRADIFTFFCSHSCDRTTKSSPATKTWYQTALDEQCVLGVWIKVKDGV